MPGTYISRYGYDWPKEYSDTFIDLTVAKKWRLLEASFGKCEADPGDCLIRAVRSLWPDDVTVTPWAETMLRDFVREDKYEMIGCGSSGKSYIMAAAGICYWISDPFHTAVIVGSSTLTDLKTRVWAPIVQLVSSLKNNSAGVPVPGKRVDNAYAIVNEKDESMPGSVSQRASIQGRALDEGRVQGLHLPWVLFLVDEMALIRDVDALKTSFANSRIGTLGWKCMAAANPEPWDHSTSCFILPAKGVTVTEDTGSWRSASGWFVRHFDGLRSPVVADPSLKARYPFLMSREDIADILSECQGDEGHPRFYKMCRGFPARTGSSAVTVLDAVAAAQGRATAPLAEPFAGRRRRVGLAAGVDPAWSDAGDDAIYCGVEAVEQDGRVYLDFSGRTVKLPVSVRSPDPVTKQLRDGVLLRMRADGGPAVRGIYVDTSGNQGLADDIDIYVGPGCGHVNNGARASASPVRDLDSRPASAHIYDRGTEAWHVLAEFIRADQVRGLPQRVVDALVQRRYAVRPRSSDLVTPARLEKKEDFIRRFKSSPNEADAAALAALAVKERLGVLPYGGVPAPAPEAVAPQAYPGGAGAGGVTVSAGDGCVRILGSAGAAEDTSLYGGAAHSGVDSGAPPW